MFLMILAGMLVGALLGCLPGMGIGGIIGVARRGSLPTAHDASPEPAGLWLRAVILPLLAEGGLLAFCITVFNPWLISRL